MVRKNVILTYLVYFKNPEKSYWKEKRESSITASPKDYYDKNRAMIRLWLVVGAFCNKNLAYCLLIHWPIRDILLGYYCRI